MKLKVPEGKGIKEAPNSDLTCTGKAEFLKLKYIYVVSSAFHLSNLAVRHSVKYLHTPHHKPDAEKLSDNYAEVPQ